MTIYSKSIATPDTKGAYKYADGFAYFQHDPKGRKETDDLWNSLEEQGAEVSTFPLDEGHKPL